MEQLKKMKTISSYRNLFKLVLCGNPATNGGDDFNIIRSPHEKNNRDIMKLRFKRIRAIRKTIYMS
jgi:hypothetical protein